MVYCVFKHLPCSENTPTAFPTQNINNSHKNILRMGAASERFVAFSISPGYQNVALTTIIGIHYKNLYFEFWVHILVTFAYHNLLEMQWGTSWARGKLQNAIMRFQTSPVLKMPSLSIRSVTVIWIMLNICWCNHTECFTQLGCYIINGLMYSYLRFVSGVDLCMLSNLKQHNIYVMKCKSFNPIKLLWIWRKFPVHAILNLTRHLRLHMWWNIPRQLICSVLKLTSVLSINNVVYFIFIYINFTWNQHPLR